MTPGALFFLLLCRVRTCTMYHVGKLSVTVNVSFLPPCLSWNIFIPNKPVFTQEAAPGCHSIPVRLFGGAIGFPANKQADLRAFPSGLPQLWWSSYLLVFGFFPPKENTNICSNYLDEGEGAALLLRGEADINAWSCRPIAGFLCIQAEIGNRNQFMWENLEEDLPVRRDRWEWALVYRTALYTNYYGRISNTCRL